MIDLRGPLVAPDEREGGYSNIRPPIPEFPFCEEEDECENMQPIRKTAKEGETVMTILKSMICCAVLLLPHAWLNGGLLFSFISTIFIFFLTLFCMQRLVNCCDENIETFTDIAYAAIGNIGKYLVNVSLVASQLGFCCVISIFVAQNMQDFIYSVSGCSPSWKIPLGALIAAQMPFYIPLSWIRRIKYFSIVIIIADLIIVICLFFIIFESFFKIWNVGPSKVQLLNKKYYATFLATAVYMFEGIGMVLPIRSAMDPHIKHKFPTILKKTMFIVFATFCSFASIVYLAFGSTTHAVIFVNLPINSINLSIQIGYTIAMFLSFPLMLFPAVSILERIFFTPGGEVTLKRKIIKNCIRAVVVMFTLLLGFTEVQNLDKIVAFIGSYCCIPLAFIYPCLFHILIYYKKKSYKSNIIDILIILLTILYMLISTYIHIYTKDTSNQPTALRCDYLDPRG
eukprot:GHVL01021119.1.p1 GENE.GHVL01021119.1~~GHVL01021119.1.p1  ORF type:complete len:455 (+),score=83.40 GHVL01021119.1:51-1415(+)